MEFDGEEVSIPIIPLFPNGFEFGSDSPQIGSNKLVISLNKLKILFPITLLGSVLRH